jgi:hypothetical protein
MPVMAPDIDAAAPLVGPLLTMPAPASEMPRRPAEETVPSLVMVQVVMVVPSMPSMPAPVEFTAPVAVMTSGLSAGGFVRLTGPAMALVIVLPLSSAWK